MARQARLVVPGVVHHVVARGVNKTCIFRHGFDKGQYLKRAALIALEEDVSVHGYCLMSNHVHFLLTPTTARGLARFFSRLHTWWATAFNRKAKRTGHLFQCRYFSSPLSECHYWAALRYIELNPVRAQLVKCPEDWLWCSARDHLNLRRYSPIALSPVLTRARVDPHSWRTILQEPSDEDDERIRQAHRSSRPCGSADFIAKWKRQLHDKVVRTRAEGS